jgi:hypothetical protein
MDQQEQEKVQIKINQGAETGIALGLMFGLPLLFYLIWNITLTVLGHKYISSNKGDDKMKTLFPLFIAACVLSWIPLLGPLGPIGLLIIVILGSRIPK